ncbi:MULTISPECIES: DHH family phosphoesterase [Myroides]|uniref:Bifunctional oligoribonuclease/PAP phosphatase NrnA n=1 Tax=Myroides albus TaxID=2562892 RepID=A0A6I3LPV5_9FLAO|nr:MULTISPECIES: bifunctional oligoribonuclease/PAP phosphatase NrnA [Myroides]MTG98142.1 bifunctional oligoribonuclease/PAP phosphatase NrnA [Myroides albus]MVX35428.1 bifunctional oligoribonuclease/PAP phosphatase NrnA [Myroides sp. LoEW2-1]UVD78629.1 bifunctional oligoribonuclease/PAP phosphatase NrnA [Myroides albus]
MINENKLEALKSIIASGNNFVIIPHRNPDGDAIGSTLGLYHVLTKLNKKATVITPNDFPNFLSWMPGTNSIVNFEYHKDKASKLMQAADYIFTLDFNVLLRTGDEMEKYLSNIDKPFIMIDHHQMPGDYAELTFSHPEFGSTCELLYTILSKLDFAKYISKDAATCIYTGIVTDSGSFRFPKTNAATHRAIADLIEKGIDNPQIHNNLFDNSSYNKLQLMGRALQNLIVLPEYNTSFIFLKDSDLKEFQHEKGDTEGLVNYGLSIKGIDFTAFFIERTEENIIKISFRSQGNFDVNKLARAYFEGGGHVNAAGGKSTKSLADTIDYFKDIVSKHKNEFYD